MSDGIGGEGIRIEGISRVYVSRAWLHVYGVLRRSIDHEPKPVQRAYAEIMKRIEANRAAEARRRELDNGPSVYATKLGRTS